MVRHFIIAAILSIAGTSCTVHEVNTEVEAPLTLSETWKEDNSAPSTPDKWWESFNDPRLNSFVTEALESNLSLSQAWARLRQAGALEKQANARFMPDVSAEVGAGRQRGPGFGGNTTSNQFNAGVSVGYEADLWGKVGALHDAAVLDVQASRLDVESLAMSLVAQVVNSWFNVLEQQGQLTLLQAQEKVSADYLGLVEARFGQGEAAAVDVFQQRQALSSLQSRIPNTVAGLELARHQLAVLLGRMPQGAPIAQGVLPSTPPVPSTGIPASLLTRRPDVRAAQLRVISADHRVGAAIADQFPSLRLGANVGTQAPELDDLVSDFVWGIVGSVTTSLWDAGLKEAEVERTKMVVKERIQGFGDTLLSSMKEVEDAMVQNRYQSEYIHRLKKQKELAESTLKEARNRYINGLSSYLPVLNALQQVQDLERSLLAAQRGELSYRTQLNLALGGSWTQNLANPYAEKDEDEDEDEDEEEEGESE